MKISMPDYRKKGAAQVVKYLEGYLRMLEAGALDHEPADLPKAEPHWASKGNLNADVEAIATREVAVLKRCGYIWTGRGKPLQRVVADEDAPQHIVNYRQCGIEVKGAAFKDTHAYIAWQIEAIHEPQGVTDATLSIPRPKAKAPAVILGTLGVKALPQIKQRRKPRAQHVVAEQVKEVVIKDLATLLSEL